MDVSQFCASASVVIEAPAEALYDFIADMPSVGQVSPVCTGGEWESDERGVGATFIGSNTTAERSWQARMRVTASDRPREFAWVNLGLASVPPSDELAENVRWRYTFTTVQGGTKVEESWQILESASDALKARSEEQLRELELRSQLGIEQTLTKLKQLFES